VRLALTDEFDLKRMQRIRLPRARIMRDAGALAGHLTGSSQRHAVFLARRTSRSRAMHEPARGCERLPPFYVPIKLLSPASNSRPKDKGGLFRSYLGK